MSVRKIEARDLETGGPPDPDDEGDEPDDPDEPDTIKVRAGWLTWWLGRQAARLGWALGWASVMSKWLSPIIVAAVLYLLSEYRWFAAAGVSMINPWVFEAAMRWCLRRTFWFAGGRIPYRPPGGIDPERVEEAEGDGGSA